MNIQKVNVSGETAVTFAAFYPFIWIKNIGANDAYAANFSGFDAGDNDVACIPAGEAVRLDAMSNVVYIKSTGTTVYAHAQNVVESPFLDNFVAGGEAVIESLSITENGTYIASGGVDGYSPVSVTVPQTTVQSLNVTTNGTYTAPTGTAYSPVTVDVQEQPWAPLQDGYSNFWFELTNDTLSPWLKFSAKNADAVIDWGDGSGEQSLDTLTPTHTYAKAGRYVVKCKGVTGISYQFVDNTNDSIPSSKAGYTSVLKSIELNEQVLTLSTCAFRCCCGLENIITYKTMLSGSSTDWFSYCTSLKNITFPTDAIITQIPYGAFYSCVNLKSVTIPASVNTIGKSAFENCYSLNEVHMLRATPPTKNQNMFRYLPTDYIIYIPQGSLSSYQSRWGDFASHLVEESE